MLDPVQSLHGALKWLYRSYLRPLYSIHQPPVTGFRRAEEFNETPSAKVLQIAADSLLRAFEVVGDVRLAKLPARLHLLQGPLLAFVVFWGISAG